MTVNLREAGAGATTFQILQNLLPKPDFTCVESFYIAN
jgi:hypothetical protein